MNNYLKDINVFTMSRDLPIRHGKRPMTIGGPLHVQSCDHGDERALRHLPSEVSAWPDVEEAPNYQQENPHEGGDCQELRKRSRIWGF
jgi:hypothetical protein